MKIVFVILHYLAIDETYKSVDSIEKKIDTDMYKIVIVIMRPRINQVHY